MRMLLIRRLVCLFTLIFSIILIPLGAFSLDLVASGIWEYAPAEASQEPADISGLEFRKLNHLHDLQDLVPDKQGFLWVRLQFIVPDNLLDTDVALLLGRIDHADQIYFNGTLLGSHGRFPPRYFSDWNTYRYYSLYSYHDSKDVQILFKIYVNSTGSISGTVKVGPQKEIFREYQVRTFAESGANGIISALLILISVYTLLIFLKRPQEKYLLLYTILAIAFAVYQSNFFITRVPAVQDGHIPYLFFQKVVFISLYIALFCNAWFIAGFLKEKLWTWLQKVFAGIFILTLIGLLISPDLQFLNTFRNMVRPVIFLPVFYSIYVLIAGLVHQKEEARVILFGLIPLILTIFYDLIVLEILKRPGVYLSGFGSALFIISILFIIANRFVNYANQVERMNVDLERTVEERTLALQNAVKKLETLASTDTLTEVLNRRAFYLRYEEELKRARRTQRPISILMIDIDHFKKINDQYGHLCGDECLRQVVHTINENIRRPADLLARYGGEEFVVLLPETEIEGAKLISEHIRQGIENLKISFSDYNIQLTISIGSATLVPDTELLMDKLIGAADEALYQAKNSGRNKVITRVL